ncbi:MAG: topoisomerase protein [Candidatus Uhrbacteria bacterium GW2011_GWF2_39_13]|uniref:DNA topoisomerase 1 n=1 Tax=Candidatus Uhrbacteria bacterium GW2011_GWF2_39_13 TaxID=1618995 RepID=A0A0G0MX80_9BACT|nr:MAG: topoisomerase protein [Candidatus Uhrbacteria bacterium GW2011_GWF2_39_13]HAU66356.1 type I DNA topoisomerase [Candidatus Uhrbacteria bacterium]
MSNLLIVESPTKAKTISKYLGKDYKVLSSFGHIRDLPKSKLGVDVEHGFEPTYLIPTKSKKAVAELKKAAKEAEMVYLATDEDREGEAIAWHVAQALNLDSKKYKRVTFHEITREAIEEAVKHPRDIDEHLVDAQQARRILDRLVGYELSPFLWQKIRYGLSAGRVQSVAMRLIVERERERRAFIIEEYWTIDGEFQKDSIAFPAKLISLDGNKIEKMDLKIKEQAEGIVKQLAGAQARVISVEKKLTKKAPPTPYTTSTLQIDANTKLGFSAKQTMRLAQELYETGRITYMRTDSLNLAEKFLEETQQYIRSAFGEKYVEGSKRYKTKKKGAQEAHEAIRPTDVTLAPSNIKTELESRVWKLYNLIWNRTVASQLPSAQVNRTSVDIMVSTSVFRASGSSVAFDGFMKVYQSTKEKLLPDLVEAELVETKAITCEQHFTEPPARYSDASLVKALEEFGIGRPSTYAPTISTIIDRGYVERDDHKKLAPTDIALIVNDVLVEHFRQIVDYEFTAIMENTLDEVAEGKVDWVPTLEAFYGPFHKNLQEKSKLLNREDIMPDRILGIDPETKLPISVKTGRFGGFVQVGEYTKEDKEEGKPKPKSASLLKGMNIESLTLAQALECLSLPREVGVTEEGEKIMAALGRFGPYLKAGDVSASLKEPYDPINVDEATARMILKESAELKKKMVTPIAEFGKDPASDGEILLKHGRFGPYLTDGITNASLGRKLAPELMTRELAIEMLTKKRGQKPRYKKPEPKKKQK